MGIILSSKKASLLTSPWFFSWTMYVLKNSIRRGKRFIPDPKRSFESVFQNLQGKVASPSHIWEKIQQRIPDVTSYPKAALENIKDKVPETLSQIKQNLPDVSSFSQAALENLKGKTEAASEVIQKIKGDIFYASGYPVRKLNNLKGKVGSACHNLKDDVLPGIVSQARSKMTLPSLIPPRSFIIKNIKSWIWKSILTLFAFSLAQAIFASGPSIERFMEWIVTKSAHYLRIFFKKIWSIILKGIKFIWNKMKQAWQNYKNRSERQDTDSGAERNPSSHQNNPQASSVEQRGQRTDVNNEAVNYYESFEEGVMVQRNGEKCPECQQKLKVAKVGNAPLKVCANSKCVSYSLME